ncbi:MAG: DegT/DnrJ/EryC1/StrS family aminotransferase [Desulfomonilaceae bacterium]
MNWKVPLADVTFGPEEQEAVRRVLESGWVSMGPETEQFEAEFAEYMGVKHAVAVSSGTAALHLSLLALGIGPGDEVIVPSLTFVATANPVLYVGATPVFADITSQDDWTISPDEIERKITDKTRAIIVMHYGGFPCRMDRIKAIAEKHGLKVVEDAAHAPGSSFQGKKLGTWGDAGCFSFFSNKNMTTAEGGMVTTADDDVAARVRILRSHGMTTLTWDRHRGHSFSYDVVAHGYNYRMDEIRASIGRVQLEKLDRSNQRRREITLEMRNNLKDITRISLPFQAHDLNECSCHIFPILLQSADLRIPFMESMKQSGIQTSIHYPPIHRFSGYKKFRTNDLPLTDHVTATEVTLPMFPAMEEQHTAIITRAAKTALESEYIV